MLLLVNDPIITNVFYLFFLEAINLITWVINWPYENTNKYEFE